MCVTAYGRIRAALLALAQDAQAGREERLRFGEAQLRRACAERGLDWDRLSEDERESYIDALLNEMYPCRLLPFSSDYGSSIAYGH